MISGRVGILRVEFVVVFEFIGRFSRSLIVIGRPGILGGLGSPFDKSILVILQLIFDGALLALLLHEHILVNRSVFQKLVMAAGADRLFLEWLLPF